MQFGLKTPGLQLRGPAMKNIALCCDDTRGKYDTPDKNTNVVRLFEWLGQDGPDQISYYDPGVGTQQRTPGISRYGGWTGWPSPCPAWESPATG